MLREVSMFGALTPSPLIYIIVGVTVFLVLDQFVSRLGVYRLMWHPPLARLCLFVCMFWAMSLLSTP
jgi:hypothetical protein